jgi:hypothetical protein
MAPTTKSDRKTRPSNVDQHPGAPDQRTTHRKTAQVAAAQQDVNQKAKELAAKKASGHSRVARLEDEMAMEDIQSKDNAAHPVPNTRKVASKKTAQVHVAYDDIYSKCYIILIYLSREQTHILDSDLDFGSDKIVADAESLPSQDSEFVDHDTDMDGNLDEEPAVLPGKGKKPAQPKESARSSITAARAVSAQKGNRKAALPESDSDLEIIDVQRKRKAADIGRMRQVHYLWTSSINHVMISEAAKKGKGSSKLGGLIPSYAARSSAASTASETIPARSSSSRPKPRPVTKHLSNLDPDSETESFIKRQPLYRLKAEKTDDSVGDAKFVYGGFSDDEKDVPIPAGLPSQQVNYQRLIVYMLLLTSSAGGCCQN